MNEEELEWYRKGYGIPRPKLQKEEVEEKC